MFGRKKKKSAGQTAAERVRERHENPPRPEQYRTIQEYRDAKDEASRLLIDRRLEKDAMPLDTERIDLTRPYLVMGSGVSPTSSTGPM